MRPWRLGLPTSSSSRRQTNYRSIEKAAPSQIPEGGEGRLFDLTDAGIIPVMINKIFSHSCEDMSELADNSVSLTVTSPPYWNAIDYDIHATDKSQRYRTRAYSNGYTEYEQYLEWLENVNTFLTIALKNRDRLTPQ